MKTVARKSGPVAPKAGEQQARDADLPAMPEVRRRLATLTSPFRRSPAAPTDDAAAPEVSGPADWRRGL